MALLDFPDPVAWISGAKNAGLERDELKMFISMAYSAQIAFLWRSGDSWWAQKLGEGKALQDTATAMYLTLRDSSFIALTVPQELLKAENLSRFQTKGLK